MQNELIARCTTTFLSQVVMHPAALFKKMANMERGISTLDAEVNSSRLMDAKPFITD